MSDNTFFVNCDTAEKKWEENTLVIPTVSVGNVGQLAADLLISSLWMNKIGYLYDDSVLPVVGNDAFATGDSTQVCKLTTAVEVYESTDHKVIVVQQRAPLIKGKRKQFTSRLMDWIKSCRFKQVIILTSSFAHERLDAQLQGTQLRFMISANLKQEVGPVLQQNLNWVELERRPPLPGSDSNSEELADVYIPGAGIAKDLYQKCVAEGFQTALLLAFVSEGDNASDAVQLATYLNSWHCWVDLLKSAQHLPPNQQHGWKYPYSWRLQYGSRFQQVLYS